ncbi:carbon-nitrogen hydrolase family protein [Emcibacter sp.]|uniref:carbon-nitrogen hydrolase family protein n=1 Tax=Emcibacter sp. TaxID=1979954 RepID=UPI003A959249
MKLLSCQIPQPEIKSVIERDEHVRLLCDKLDEAMTQVEADVIMLPELATSGYPFGRLGEVHELAEEIGGQSVQVLRDLALRHKTAVCFGMPRRETDSGDLHISQVFIHADGEVGFYDKIHLHDSETEVFTPGDHLYVTKVGGVKLGIIICYDFRFPELCRLLKVEHGVDVILHATAFLKDDTYKSWAPFVMTRALENEVYILSQNFAGDAFGGTLFSPPDFNDNRQVERLPDQEFFHVFEVDEALLAAKKKSAGYLDVLRESYTGLQLR